MPTDQEHAKQINTDPDELEEELRLGREFMKEYREVFKALAKL